jgi:hypothetical protein
MRVGDLTKCEIGAVKGKWGTGLTKNFDGVRDPSSTMREIDERKSVGKGNGTGGNEKRSSVRIRKR